MPELSLVVCLHGERDLLQRLLDHTAGLYDDLLVVHDGPDTRGTRSLVEAKGGRFFERPQQFQQERHWPFAWQQAAHDWILRLDVDEFPSEELKEWLRNFHTQPQPPLSVSGYTCIWPLWNGRRTLTRKMYSGRIFLFDRRRIRFFGLPEHVPVPDAKFEPLDLILHHQPLRKSYGLRNVLLRKQAYRWREGIAHSLLGEPSDLPCWRWETSWPPLWQEIRTEPIRTAFRRLIAETLRGLRAQWKAERKLFPGAALNGPLNQALICLKFWQLRRQNRSSSP
jgi:hypothetical protein